VSEGGSPTPIALDPIGYVHSTRADLSDDDWGEVPATIELCEPFGADALAGLGAFSHLEVIFLFHRAEPEDVHAGARRPRGNPDWPEVGIFAQRAKDRPNHLGHSVCELVGVSGTTVEVRGLDAIDGTPVLDLKPYMVEFAPRGETRQPAWSHELMAKYY
jgi:tRNA-Thr(GGU) m(6)t(6)A37 methyltransferase TsaA